MSQLRVNGSIFMGISHIIKSNENKIRIQMYSVVEKNNKKLINEV